MADTMSHLRNMKRRFTQGNSQGDLSPAEKVDQLENTLNVFRAEVDMKLKIMQQILTTRNEQVTVQKKLLEREQTLYDTLLGHWKNTPKLAATGLSVSFSAADIIGGEENEENLSDPDYMEGDEPGPSRKKSKSSLRRQRKSGKPMPKQHKMKLQAQQDEGAGAETKGADDGTFQQEEGDNGDGTFTNTDDQDQDNEWDVELEPRSPPVQVQMKNEVEDEEDVSNFDEFIRAYVSSDEQTTEPPAKKQHRVERVWSFERYFELAQEAEKYVSDLKIWTKHTEKQTSSGQKVTYRCNQVPSKNRSSCSAGVHLLYHSKNEKVSLFVANTEHTNHVITSRGIPLSLRKEIQTIFDEGNTRPNAILATLRARGIEEPPKTQLLNFLSQYRKQKCDPVSYK